VLTVVGIVAVVTASGALRRRTALSVLLTVVTCVAFGTAARASVQDTGPLAGLAHRGGQDTLEIEVVTEPAMTPDGWWALVRVDSVGGRESGERALLRGDREPAPVLGTSWLGEASARPLDHNDFEGWLRRRHAVAALNQTAWRPVGDIGVLARSTEHVRDRIRRAATAGLSDRPAGLAVGLVTGDTRLLDDETQDRMQAAGLTHLIAVSGSNVAIVAAGAALFAGAAGLGARGRRLVIGLAVAWFVVLTRAEPSVSRAAVMAAVVLVARARGTPTSAVHSLGVAVLILLTIDPALAMSVGLLLSAAATAGVLVVAPLVQRRLTRLPRPLAAVLAATLGAQIAVAPLLLSTFGEVPLASIPANLVAVPAAALASVVVSLGSVIAVLHVGVAAPVFSLAVLPLHGVLWAADRFSSGGVVSIAAPLPLVAMVLAAIALILRPGTAGARRMGWSAGVLSLAIVVPGIVPITGRMPEVLTITAIDVGQGDAILVEGAGARVLVDVGEDDAAARWLRRRRIPIDLLVLSHPHEDHIGGLDAVLDDVRVRTIWHRPVPDGDQDDDQVRRMALKRGIAVHEPTAGQQARVGGLLVEVLGPQAGRPFRGSDRELNDMSIVVRISHDGRSVLLTGDVEVTAQRELLWRPALLRAGVLKVPHHGGATSLPEFIAAVGASDAIISAGRDNRYGHPHPDVLAELGHLGVRIHRTDIEGDVRLVVPGTVGPVGVPGEPAALRWRDAQRPPDRRRRRPPVASRDRASARAGQVHPSRRGSRPLRGGRTRASPRDAHRLAVRRLALPGAPRRPGRAGRPQG
jgi:competence protein ComEC